MKIVVLDGYAENPGDLSWEALGELGKLTVYDRTSLTDENEIAVRIGDAEIVITNKTPITAKIIDACPGISDTTTPPSTPGAGRRAPTGATGTTPSWSWRERLWASSASVASDRRRAAWPRPWV